MKCFKTVTTEINTNLETTFNSLIHIYLLIFLFMILHISHNIIKQNNQIHLFCMILITMNLKYENIKDLEKFNDKTISILSIQQF